jgi:tRNA/rRNA methyltransferase
MTSIILVEPQMGENIGATARAMKNFSITDLRIINPRDGWPNQRAIDMSVGAIDIINSAKIYDDLNSSLKGTTKLYAMTARNRYMNKPHISLHELTEINTNSAFMFGKESSGLTNEEISMADAIVTIDTDPNFSSLNIAQSVILVCYQIFKNQPQKQQYKEIDHCDKYHLAYFLDHLISLIDGKGFFKVAEKKPSMINNIRNIFTRNKLSKNELQTLIGIIKKLEK